MQDIKITKRKKRYFELAKNIAQNSTHSNFKHGAVLVKGGNIINISFNKTNYSSFGQKFKKYGLYKATVHAEIGCILGINRSRTQGSDVYVVRINNAGKYRMSKPCLLCQSVMKHVGIKRCFYTTNGNHIKCIRI